MPRPSGVACALALLLLGACRPESGPPPPNIVVVMTDDMRWDEVSFMPTVTERLVGEGLDFTNSFVTTSLCCPSRASFLSGLYAHNHGIHTLGGAPIFDATSTLAVWLHDAGYRTALVGKYMNDNGLLAPKIPPGWDVWRTFADTPQSFRDGWLYFGYQLNEDGRLVSYGHADADYSTDVLARMAVDFVRTSAAPFFLLFTPFAPHTPPTPAPRHAGRLAEATIPPRANCTEADTSDKSPYIQTAHARYEGLGPEQRAAYDAQLLSIRRGLMESLLAVDEAVAAILDALEARGAVDDTVVVFTSDNGALWMEHYALGKGMAYEESIRVPLTVRYPRLVHGARRDANLVLNIDLAPTLADLAHVPVPGKVDGRSLAGLLRDPAAPAVRDDFLVEFWNPTASPLVVPTFGAVRGRDWKYVRLEGGAGGAAFEELYDLAADPLELENLLVTAAHDPAVGERAAAMRARLGELRAQ